MPDHGHFLEHRAPKNLKTILIAAACVAIGIAAIGIVGRVLAHQGLAARTDDAAIPAAKSTSSTAMPRLVPRPVSDEGVS